MPLKIAGRCETYLRSDSPRAIPVISPLLGCVKWLFYRKFLGLREQKNTPGSKLRGGM
jgi:hypothetical protein